MRAVVAIRGANQTEAVARTLAQQLEGPSILIPYDTLLNDWIIAPGDSEAVRTVTAQQVKLLTAGYVRAGYHVIIHGSFTRDGLRDDVAVDEILRLLRTVPDVRTVSAALRGDAGTGAIAAPPSGDVSCDLDAISVDQAATIIREALHG